MHIDGGAGAVKYTTTSGGHVIVSIFSRNVLLYVLLLLVCIIAVRRRRSWCSGERGDPKVPAETLSLRIYVYIYIYAYTAPTAKSSLSLTNTYMYTRTNIMGMILVKLQCADEGNIVGVVIDKCCTNYTMYVCMYIRVNGVCACIG